MKIRSFMKKALALGVTGTVLLCLGPAACGKSGTEGGPPDAAVETEDTKSQPEEKGVRFYAYYDADQDGIEEWAPAPYGLDTGNILEVSRDENRVTLRLGTASYELQADETADTGIEGYITALDGANMEVEYDESYSPRMVSQVTVRLSEAAEFNGMPAYEATLAVKKKTDKHGMAFPNELGNDMQVYLVIEE